MNPTATPSTTEQKSTAAEVLGAPASSAPPLATTGAPKAAPADAPKTDEKIAPKLQVLIQRERSAVEREKAAKAREVAAEARAKEIEAREARIQEFENLKQTNPLKALEMLGLSYQDLTQIALQDGNVPADLQVRKVEEKLNSFVKSQEEERKAQAEKARADEEKQATATITKFKSEIGSYLKENGARYEFIQFEQQDDLVYDVIDEHYNRTLQDAIEKAKEAGEDPSDVRGEVMTIAQAADKVEAHLEQKYDKARNLAKVKALMAPRPSNLVEKPKLPTRQTPQTLNNTLSATPAAQRKSPLTDDERIQKAIAYARGIRP